MRTALIALLISLTPSLLSAANPKSLEDTGVARSQARVDDCLQLMTFDNFLTVLDGVKKTFTSRTGHPALTALVYGMLLPYLVYDTGRFVVGGVGTCFASIDLAYEKIRALIPESHDYSTQEMINICFSSLRWHIKRVAPYADNLSVTPAQGTMLAFASLVWDSRYEPNTIVLSPTVKLRRSDIEDDKDGLGVLHDDALLIHDHLTKASSLAVRFKSVTFDQLLTILVNMIVKGEEHGGMFDDLSLNFVKTVLVGTPEFKEWKSSLESASLVMASLLKKISTP